VGELAVKAGWAQVVRHAADDENRSRHYDGLVAAEQTCVVVVVVVVV
jgi:hypothetical protein